MTRAIKKPARKTKSAKAGALVVVPPHAPAHEASFREIVSLIQRARQQAFQAVNTELIDLYWQVGEYISRRISGDGWGKNTVVALAEFIRRNEPGARGFSAQNLWRMRQFFETWRGSSKLSALLRELPWTHNLSLLGKCKHPEERQFYLRLASTATSPAAATGLTTG